MTRTKGLLEIVGALAALVRAKNDLVLDLVGWTEHGDNVMVEMDQLADRLKVRDRIRFHGPKAAGPELFGYYRQADIYVIGSYFEGFPRTIWEAMAHSLPVIATQVGSIPDFVGEAAELVPPRDVEAIASAVKRLLNSPSRRRDMIRQGQELAHRVTLEKVVPEMLNEIGTWLERRKTPKDSSCSHVPNQGISR